MIAFLAAAATAACGGGDDNAVSPPEAGADAKTDATAGARTDATAGEASLPGATGSDAGAGASDAPAIPAASGAVSFVRLAQWSLAIPMVDVCIAPTGSGAFDKPLAHAAFAADDDAGVGTFPVVSAYFPTKAGTVDVRLVAGGSGDCAGDRLGADVAGVELGPRAYATIAAVDDPASGSVQPVVLGDDHSAPKGVAVRFFNAFLAAPFDASAPAGAVDVGTAALGALFTAVPFASSSRAASADAGSTRTIDKNGYATLGAMNADTLWVAAAGAMTTGATVGTTADSGPTPTVDAGPAAEAGLEPDAGAAAGAPPAADAGRTAVAQASGLSIAAGADVTFVLISRPPSEIAGAGDGAPGPAPKLLECVDNAGVAGSTSNCFAAP